MKASSSFADRTSSSTIAASVDPSSHGMGNHWKPAGFATDGDGASTAAKTVSGSAGATCSPIPSRSAPSAPYP